jgi:hypothetical protein
MGQGKSTSEHVDAALHHADVQGVEVSETRYAGEDVQCVGMRCVRARAPPPEGAKHVDFEGSRMVGGWREWRELADGFVDMNCFEKKGSEKSVEVVIDEGEVF